MTYTQIEELPLFFTLGVDAWATDEWRFTGSVESEAWSLSLPQLSLGESANLSKSCRPATPQIKIIILYIWLGIVFELNFFFFFAFIQKHNLTNEMEESSGFTVFAPTDSAIKEYLSRMGKESMVLYKHTKIHSLIDISYMVSYFCIMNFVYLFLGFECDPVSHYNKWDSKRWRFGGWTV